MAAQPRPSKWGSFLQQAVAGVEARLDTILSEAENAARQEAAAGISPGPAAPDVTSPTLLAVQPAAAASRSASPNAKPNDRLQARLARAVAARAASPAQSNISESNGSVPSLPSPRPSLDLARDRAENKDTRSGEEPADQQQQNGGDAPPDKAEEGHAANHNPEVEDTADAQDAAGAEPATHGEQQMDQLAEPVDPDPAAPALDGPDAKHREEIEPREGDKPPLETSNGSDPETTIAEPTLLLPPAPSQADDLETKLEQPVDVIQPLRDEIKSLRHQLGAKNVTIQNLEGEVRRLRDMRISAEAQAASRANDASRRHVEELEGRLMALEIEKKLVTERANMKTAEVQKELDTARERVRAVEQEKEWELKSMESRLESMRLQAEEASSKAAADSHVELLRQVETLQSQYTTAVKKWESGEARLVGRISSIEKERDEALRRESDMRKKARDSATRARVEVESLQARISQKQRELDDRQKEMDLCHSQLASARTRAEQDEQAEQTEQTGGTVSQPGTESKQPGGWKAERHEQSGHDRRQWFEEMNGSAPQSRPVSPPPLLPRRTLSSDLLGLHGTANPRRVSTPTSLQEGSGESAHNLRRLYTQPQAFSRLVLLENDEGSGNNILSPLEAPTESLYTPSGLMEDRDGLSLILKPASSPKLGQHDLASVSTSAAGPSVQLVERMSAAIRRLEAEKVANREERLRISSQRDEARAEIASLMKQMESHSGAVQRVTEMEREISEINGRYQTTLEMLGEKSELVEELRADIGDLKQMYRELVERTVHIN